MTELAPFQVARPRDVEAAIALCSENAQSRYIAGGTDLMVNIRRGIRQPDLLIDLSGVDVLNEFEITGAGARIGAGVTLARLASDPGIRERYRAVAEAAEAIAGPSHRSMATVGGNLCLDTRCIYYNQSEWWRHANQYCLKNRGDTCHVAPQGKRCHAAFSGDLAPALMVLGAEIEILGPAGRRRIPLGDLYIGGRPRAPEACAGRACHLRTASRRAAAVGLRQGAAARLDRFSPGRGRGQPGDGRRRRVGVSRRSDRHQLAALPAGGDRELPRPPARRRSAWRGLTSSCKNRCNRCARRLLPPTIAGWPPPRLRAAWPPGSPACRERLDEL